MANRRAIKDYEDQLVLLEYLVKKDEEDFLGQ